MHDITELERRIAAAFDRIDRGLEAAEQTRAAEGDRAGPTAQPPAQNAALMRALESARAASTDWAARYAQLQAEMGEQTIAMAAEIESLNAALSGGDTPSQQSVELQVMQDQINDLRRQVKSKDKELAELRSARADEIAELQSITDALTPLIEKADSDARD